MYNNYPLNNTYYNSMSNNSVNYTNEDRFLLAPFIFGGLAGTALGYGIASNNYNNSYPVPVYPIYPTYQTYPTYSSTNYYYRKS